MYGGRQLRRVIILIKLCTLSLFSSRHLLTSCVSFSASLWDAALACTRPGHFQSMSQGTFLSAPFFILSCTLCSPSLFFHSATVVFGWRGMVSTKLMYLCGVCSVNPVNFPWHNYKWPAQKLKRDWMLLRCLSRTYVHQSTSGYAINSP